MTTPILTRVLIVYCMTMAGLLLWVSQPQAPSPTAAPVPLQALPLDTQTLSESIARTLTALKLTPGDLDGSSHVTIQTHNGPASIDHLSLYLPASLPVSSVVKQLMAIEFPGLIWRRFDDENLSIQIESWVNGQPKHLISLTPSFSAHGPDAFGRPYPIALVIRNLGGSFERLAPLLNLKKKFSIAITPFDTFALQWGDEGSAAGKEIWVDLGPNTPQHVDIKSQLEAVPNAIGVWLPQKIDEVTRLFSILRASSWSALLGGPTLFEQAKSAGIRSAKPWRSDVPGRSWAERELSRLMALAVRDGCAIGVIDGPSTSLESLGFWIHGVERQGFRLIGAREAIAILEELKSQPEDVGAGPN